MVIRPGRDTGHALLLALVVILVTSMAAALVAEALALEQRLALREVESARLRALLDAGISTGVARIVEDSRYRGHEESFAGGRLILQAEPGGRTTVTLWVLARLRSRAAGGRATVALITEHGPRVVRWEPLAPASLPPGLRRRAADGS